MFASPAAMPETCVPWNDAERSSGSWPPGPEPGPGKARATITFGVVYAVLPFGKPGGYEKPLGLKNGFVWSIPSSTTPILIPAPLAPVACSSWVAPMIAGLSSRSSV